MRRRRRRTVSASERREADLFYADLMGFPPGTPVGGVMSLTNVASEAFFAELMGESIESTALPLVARSQARGLQLPSSEDFGEQRRPPPPTPSVAPTTPIPSKWAGVDRRNIPSRTVGRTEVADPPWMGTLIDNSNLRFTGAYVTGAPLPGHPGGNFTTSSTQISRGWMPNIQTLADQGWGTVFFYVGYSVGGGHPAPGGVNRARGTEHGLHLRTTLHALGPQWAGATVCIDNEDGTEVTLTPDLIEYYVGLFDEMSRPDPNLAAFRPGFYGHGKPVGQLLARRRDLFVWDVFLDTVNTNTTVAPFTLAADPLTVDPAARPLRAYEATPPGGRQAITWPLGRQFRFYTDEMPCPGSVIARRLNTWSRLKPWDYDASFVRNPAFPAAEPRIAARQYVSTSLVVADVFQARGQGANAPPPTARVISQSSAAAVAIAPAAGVIVEPDAPLTLFYRGGEMVLATMLNDGSIGVATYDGLTGAWGTIDRIAGAVPALRRSRALQGITNTVSNAHLFFIGADNRLYVKRQTKTRGGTWSAWSDGQAVIDNLRLHPFSALAGVARRGDWIETFFINEQGMLVSAWWSRRFTSHFPGFLLQRLETTPSLLPGGALAAISPHPDHLLVFGVGNDQRLQFAVFVTGRGWTPVSPLGTAQDLIGAHTRLAAHAVSTSEVEVVALTDSGSLALYPIRGTGTAWSGAARQVVADPPALTATTPVAGSASGFRINPFGDVAILRHVGQTNSTVFCAGVRGTEARTLRWNATAVPAWQSLAN